MVTRRKSKLKNLRGIQINEQVARPVIIYLLVYIMLFKYVYKLSHHTVNQL